MLLKRIYCLIVTNKLLEMFDDVVNNWNIQKYYLKIFLQKFASMRTQRKFNLY